MENVKQESSKREPKMRRFARIECDVYAGLADESDPNSGIVFSSDLRVHSPENTGKILVQEGMARAAATIMTSLAKHRGGMAKAMAEVMACAADSSGTHEEAAEKSENK